MGGKLAEAFGPVRLFVAGMIGFAVGSAGMATADGAGLLMPATMSILTGTFTGPDRPRVMALYLGVGQGFDDRSDPRWSLRRVRQLAAEILINVPVCPAGIVLVWFARPDNVHQRPHRWDLTGAGLVLVGITAVVLTLLQAPSWGPAPPATLSTLLLGIACLVLFSSARCARSTAFWICACSEFWICACSGPRCSQRICRVVGGRLCADRGDGLRGGRPAGFPRPPTAASGLALLPLL